MFFILSKLFWFAAAPLNALVLIGLAGLIATAMHRKRLGIALLAVSLVSLAAAVFSPLGTLALRPLEDRFPLYGYDREAPAGIIVLGGALDPDLSAARREYALLAAGGRLLEGAILARRYPEATLVFSGGSGMLGESRSEADEVERLWRDLGVPAAQMRFERLSRSTWENAVFTRDLVKPTAGTRWLLVTSAWHMPRAMGIFRHTGFDVVADAVDYRTFGDARDFRWPRSGADALQRLDLAVHEWIGLLAYRARGRTDALFPAP